jgi:saccharopine dehydrogenase-like NADP-dependent oxidoreductase
LNVAIVGVGAVGARAARQLASTDRVDRIVVSDPDTDKLRTVVASLGEERARAAGPEEDPPGADSGVAVALLAGPHTTHADTARRYVEAGVSVVSVADDVDEVRSLLELDAEARAHDVSVVVGAGFSPGLTCVLATHAGTLFDHIDEVHVAKVGTGGPACASAHHRALGSAAIDWRDGAWVSRRAGSGRELCWFPDPIGGEDCYRAALPDALLLAPAFAGVERITARLAANRRDRVTARFPMLRPPHPEGGLGAVRVEVRGRRGASRAVHVLGAMDRPAVAAGAVAALAAVAAGTGELRRTGAGGLAEMVEPVPFLSELARRGVKAAVFEGAAAG